VTRIELAVTCLPVPTNASENVAVPEMEIESLEMRLSEYDTVAASDELYTLLLAVIDTVNDLATMDEVAVGAPTRLSV
jgi:hypothetical protein